MRLACGIALQAVSRYSPDAMKRHAAKALPAVFFAMHGKKATGIVRIFLGSKFWCTKLQEQTTIWQQMYVKWNFPFCRWMICQVILTELYVCIKHRKTKKIVIRNVD